MQGKGKRPLPLHPIPSIKWTRKCQVCARSKLSGIRPSVQSEDPLIGRSDDRKKQNSPLIDSDRYTKSRQGGRDKRFFDNSRRMTGDRSGGRLLYQPSRRRGGLALCVFNVQRRPLSNAALRRISWA